MRRGVGGGGRIVVEDTIRRERGVLDRCGGGGGSKGLVPGDEGAAGGSGIVIIRYKFQ